MIEKHYAAHIKPSLDAAAMQSKKTKNSKEGSFEDG
jgi:hypothetical protein